MSWWKGRLTLNFDHRVLDGKPASDVLERLQVVLKTQIIPELQMLIPEITDNDHGPVSALPNWSRPLSADKRPDFVGRSI